MDQEPEKAQNPAGHTPDLDKKRETQSTPPGVSTLPSTTLQAEETELNSLFSTDYHLTVRLRQKLERRQVSLLLGVLCYQATYYGVNFKMYLSLLHLNEILIGNKIRASQIKDRFERLSVELSQVIIRDLAGRELLLEGLVQLSQVTRSLLINSKGLMTKDTYQSRVAHWRPENWITVKTVPVDVIIERSGNSVRYTSYCKGYGEGSGTARRGKTGRSAELDGEETPVWILSQTLSDKELTQEVFLLAHFEWLKRSGTET